PAAEPCREARRSTRVRPASAGAPRPRCRERARAARGRRRGSRSEGSGLRRCQARQAHYGNSDYCDAGAREAGGAGEPDDPGNRAHRVADRELPDTDQAGPDRNAEQDERDTGNEEDDGPDRPREVGTIERARCRSNYERSAENDLEGGVELQQHPLLSIVYETTVSLMARPVDPHRREAVRAQAADYVLERGLARLSLRPLAKALGTSPRMLLYDFGTKERLIHEILGEIRNREAAQLRADVHTLEDVWRWIAAPELAPILCGKAPRPLNSYLHALASLGPAPDPRDHAVDHERRHAGDPFVLSFPMPPQALAHCIWDEVLALAKSHDVAVVLRQQPHCPRRPLAKVRLLDLVERLEERPRRGWLDSKPAGELLRARGPVRRDEATADLGERGPRLDLFPADPLVGPDERDLVPARRPVAELPDRCRRADDVAPARSDPLAGPCTRPPR